jgi:tellurite resistance protein TehA-like permease
MSTSDHGVPSALRDRVFADLRPVRPLADPWKRALVLAPLGLALLGLVHLRYGTRGDLGGLLLWGLALLQIAVGVGLVVAALREVIPDRALVRSRRSCTRGWPACGRIRRFSRIHDPQIPAGLRRPGPHAVRNR